jgi:uncharacterized protein (TIGR02453 family)
MVRSANKNFSGFFPSTQIFLRNLQKNNNKSWFEKNRSVYREVLLWPMQQLVMDLHHTISEIDPDIETRPLINRAISNIYRDTRFSKDKSLFKERMWLVFKRPSKEWKEKLPGFFFEIDPESYRYGMGYYSASRPVMDAFRKTVLTNPARFSQLVSFRLNPKNKMLLEGETYKRPVISEFPAELKEWFNLKTFYFCCDKKSDAVLYSSDLVVELQKAFIQLAPLYRFLIGLVPEESQR